MASEISKLTVRGNLHINMRVIVVIKYNSYV